MSGAKVFGAALASLTLTALALELPSAGTRDAKRPYEMVWAGRNADEYPSFLKLDSADGWTCETRDSAASLATADEHLLFEDGVLRLRYRATGKKPEVRFSPPAPCEIKEPFDTVGIWVYGNNFYGSGAPPTSLTARFLDSAGIPFTVFLGDINHREWFKFQRRLTQAQRRRVEGGAKFLGFTLTRGTNTEERMLEFASFSCFNLVQKPLKFKPRPKRGVQIFKGAPQGANTGAGKLPFPNTARTVLPPEVTPDKGIEFRFPKEPGVWDDLAFRIDGGEWRRLAVGGGVWPRSQAGKAEVRFWRDGDSLVADVVVKGGEVEELRFGGIDLPEDSEEIVMPFYTYGVSGDWRGRPAVVAAKLGGKAVFVSATLDWTQSNASKAYPRGKDLAGYFSANGAAQYLPRTDGRRNDVYERFVWTVSRRFEATLPTIPNPPSPWRHFVGSRVWLSEGACRDRKVNYRSNFHRYRSGMTEIVSTDHETGWRDGEESFTFRTEPAPKKGGDKGQDGYARYLIDTLGFRYGVYNNFTDLAPVNAHWHTDNALLGENGMFRESWSRCYAPKPLYGVEKCRELLPVIQRKFNLNAAYSDVHTAVTPWSRTDYDARVPGAGTFAQTFYAFGEILLTQKEIWNGPVYSEGGNHWLYAGLVDGNYSRDMTYNLGKRPWLVDFDLLRKHPLAGDAMGLCEMFYGDGKVPKDRWEALGMWFAAGLAFGRIPYLEWRFQEYSYYMALAISSRYSREKVKSIRYVDGKGRLIDTSEAVISKAYARSQVAVAYDGGTLVAVNGNRDGEWMKVRRGKGALLLPPTGFFAAGGDVVVYSGPLGDNPRADFCASDGYVYLNGRGRYMECPGGATSGHTVRLRKKDGTEEFFAFGAKPGTEAVLPYKAEKITGLDYKERKDMGDVGFTVDGRGWTRFKTKAGCFSYRVVPAAGTVFASPAEYETAALVGKDAAVPAPVSGRGR